MYHQVMDTLKPMYSIGVNSENANFLRWVLFIELYEFYKTCELFCLKPSYFEKIALN